MKDLKYTLIKSEKQYYEYCRIHEELVHENEIKYEQELELLELLIDKWDQDHSILQEKELDPIELLKIFMEDHELKAKDLAGILGLTKGTVSKMLNYQKGLSKASIRILADRFKVRQEAFNRPYPLVGKGRKELQKAS
jgi:HTH-type transcriptional regulator/antitoxin HigA